MRRRSRHLLLTTLLCMLVAACGTDSGSGGEGSALDGMVQGQTAVSIDQSGNTGSGSSVSLRLTDAPIDDLVRAVVRFTAIEFKAQSGGWTRFTLAAPQSIDLLELQGGRTADLLVNVPLTAGHYREIRLFISGNSSHNFVEESGGGIEQLQIPSGSSSGIKLEQDFAIPANQAASFIIDIDLRQSILSPGNVSIYRLNPVMRMVMPGMTGGIRGQVDSSKLTAVPPTCSDTQVGTYNAVYVFAGHDVIPSDINQLGNNTEPLTTTSINYDAARGKYLYEVAFLPAGLYTVAVTCNANLDDLEADDNLQFFDIQNVTVVKNNVIFL